MRTIDSFSSPMSRRALVRLGVSAVAFGGVPGLSRVTPAAAQTPAAGPEEEPLFSVVFSRDWQPEGMAQGAFYRILLEPGEALTYLPGPYCGCSGEIIREGTAAERVMSGVYAVTLDRPFSVQRADGSVEEVAAGTEVTLGEGDVSIYPDALAFGDLRNAGEETIVLYGASITSLERDEGTFTPELPDDASVRLSVAVYDAWKTLGEGDIAATLTRRVLEPGGSIGPYEITGLEAIHVPEGELHAGVIRPTESEPTADPLYVRSGGTVAFRKYTPGTRRVLANDFDEPVTLLTLRFTGA
jgi:hypothetical protein